MKVWALIENGKIRKFRDLYSIFYNEEDAKAVATQNNLTVKEYILYGKSRNKKTTLYPRKTKEL